MNMPKVKQPTLLFPKVRPTDKRPGWGQGKGLSLITMAKHWARYPYPTCILFPNSHSNPMDSPILGEETDSERSSDLPQVTQKVSGRTRTDIQVYLIPKPTWKEVSQNRTDTPSGRFRGCLPLFRKEVPHVSLSMGSGE